jgi:hypothetical protein
VIVGSLKSDGLLENWNMWGGGGGVYSNFTNKN